MSWIDKLFDLAVINCYLTLSLQVPNNLKLNISLITQEGYIL